MKKTQQIVIVVLPLILSIVLIRWIIVSGPELRIGINDYLFKKHSLIMGDWELDHATFGFSLGAPLLIWTIVLKITKQLSLLRLTMYTLFFYLLQIIGISIQCYLFVDVLSASSSLIPFSFLGIPDFWFWNLTLIIASIFSYLALSSLLIIGWFNRRKHESTTLDS